MALAERKRIARCTGKDLEYKDLKLEVRRRIHCDRRKWLEDKCKHIESSGRNHDVREVFNIIKSILKNHRSAQIKHVSMLLMPRP